jgi:hypothetical protein
MLQGGCLDVNIGSANRTGWCSVMRRFMSSNLTKSARIMGKNIMRCDDATNLLRRERYRNFDTKYPKENFHSGDILQKKI